MLAIWLGASVSLHATVLVLVPAVAPTGAPPGASRLEVLILPPTLLPVAAFDPAPLPPASKKPEPQHAPAAAEARPLAEQPAPVLAGSEPGADEPRSFPVSAEYRDPEPAAPGRKTQAPGAAVRTQNLNAAYLSNPAPSYPLASRSAGEQGTVTLRVLVARDGSASRVEVEKSSGSPHLDAAALEAVKAWRFAPARRGADAIESWMLVPIVFRLEG